MITRSSQHPRRHALGQSQHEFIAMKRLNAVWGQCRRRKVFEVGGHTDFGPSLDGSSECMAIVLVRERELADQAVVVGYVAP